jgi:hypothetical protein
MLKGSIESKKKKKAHNGINSMPSCRAPGSLERTHDIVSGSFERKHDIPLLFSIFNWHAGCFQVFCQFHFHTQLVHYAHAHSVF